MAEIIFGRNPVKSSLECDRVKKIYVSFSFSEKSILDLASNKKIPLVRVNNGNLGEMSHGGNHQGIVAEVKPFEYSSFDEIVNYGKNKEYPLIIILDGIEDPHNLGAILRVADAFDATGVFIKKAGQVHLNATVAKVSTGAINYVKVAEVSNLTRAIEQLQKLGYWVVATDGSAEQSYVDVDYKMPVALIIGSEGKGISDLVLKHSDFVVKIPMYGHVNSLNASNACSVLISHIEASRHNSSK